MASNSDIITGIVLSIIAAVLASVVIAYTAQTAPPRVPPGSVVDGTRKFLMILSIIVLVLVVLYWIFTGVQNRARIAALAGM